MGKKTVVLLIIGLAILAILAGMIYFISASMNSSHFKKIEKVKVRLKFGHQAQFAGFYVAKERGIYKKYGLDVELTPIDFKDPTVKVVDRGDADFGIIGSNQLIKARSDGLDLKAIAVIYQKLPNCTLSLKKSGVKKPSDFVNKTVGVQQGTDGASLYPLMLKTLGIDRSKIREVSIKSGVDELLFGKIDVMATAFSINEPHIAIQAGHEVNIILMADYGIDIYGDTIVTSDKTIKARPQLVYRFLKATLEGWDFVIKNPEEAGKISLGHVPKSNMAHQVFMARQSIPLIHVGDVPVGWMKKARWIKIQDLLIEHGVLKEEMDIESVYSMEFITRIRIEKHK